MDIFDSNLKGLDIEVLETEAPEEAVLTEERTAKKKKFGKLKAVFTALIVLTCFSSAVFGASEYVSTELFAYNLTIDGKSAGLFTSEEEAMAVVEEYKAELCDIHSRSLDFCEEVHVEQVAVNESTCITAEAAAETVHEMLTPVTDANAIYVNDKFFFAVDTYDDAKLILNAVLNNYAEGKEEITSIAFAEKIEIKPVSIFLEDIMPVDEGYEYLLNAKIPSDEYIVEQDNETLLSVAQRFNIDYVELHGLNPALNTEELHKGERVALTPEENAVNVILTRTTASMETIPFETQKVDNPDVYRGIETVLQEGVDGVNKNTFTVTEVNGKVISNELDDTEVLVAVSDYVIERGTKTVVAARYFNRTLGKTKVDIEQEFIWPLTGIITDSFGKKRSTGIHTGLDIAVNTGTEVKAMADGVVVLSERESAYGNLIKIDHGDGVETWYAHLSKRKVALGDVVKQGDVIGLSGNTGRSTGPHLHVEVRIDQVAFNALWYLP
ncbi:MAG: peptidoglycan DD-metalloendopeptidase family protein [Firmicutes bacterium]|nr:peptidoglycan DD-metalloendopeptidase family protein [Bacillota bacterium]